MKASGPLGSNIGQFYQGLLEFDITGEGRYLTDPNVIREVPLGYLQPTSSLSTGSGA